MKKTELKASVLMIVCITIFGLVIGCSNVNQDNFEDVSWTLEDVYYGTNRSQSFNIIMPEGKKDVHAIVYLHGGFYYFGNKLWYPLFLTDFSDDNIFVTIDYRLTGVGFRANIHMDEMIADVDNALKKITEIANERGYTISGFILAGHSAGAHIGLLYGYQYFKENSTRPIKITACVSLAGPTDYTDDAGWSSMEYYGETVEDRLSMLSSIGTLLTGYEIKLTQADWTKQANWPEYENYAKKISPVMYVDSAAAIPPTLLVHGRDDIIVPYSNAERLAQALDNTDTPHKLITASGSGNNHMLGGEPSSTDSTEPITYTDQTWIDEVKAWMEAYL
jgi:acetyl esterase/lipase